MCGCRRSSPTEAPRAGSPRRRPAVPRRERAFSLLELMISLAVTGLVVAGTSGFFVANKNRNLSEDLNSAVEQSLRFAADRIAVDLRNSSYGVPASNRALWIPWVAGFTVNPSIESHGSAADSLSVAHCTLQPLTTLASAAGAGATTLTLATAASLDTWARSLVFIDERESALVRSVSGSTITIDTDPTKAGNQGLANSVSRGASVCRVDVATYSIDGATKTLRLDLQQGDGPRVLADGIVDLRVIIDSSGMQPQYQVRLTGETGQIDPVAGAFTRVVLTTHVTPRR